MDENQKRNRVGILALILAFAALGVAGAAYVSLPAPVATVTPATDPQVELTALRKDLADLRAELAKVRQDLEMQSKATADLRQVPAPVDQSELRRLVGEQIKQALAQAKPAPRLTPEGMPKPVQDALAKVAPGVEITRSEQRQRNDQTYYRLRGRLNGEELDYRIAPDGGVLEADLPLAIVPENLKQAAAQAVPGWQIEDATQRLQDGAVIFDLGGRAADRKKYEIRLAVNGQVLKVEPDGGNHHGVGGHGGEAQKPPAPPPVQENF